MRNANNVAFLIMAHAVNEQLKLLVESLLLDERSRLYIHIDKKTKNLGWLEKNNHANVHVLQDRVAVHWGGKSMIDATQALLKAALLENSNRFFMLLTGSCFPVKHPHTVVDFILKQQQPIFQIWGKMQENLAQNENFGRYVVTKRHPLDCSLFNPKTDALRAFLWNIYKAVNNLLPYERKVDVKDLWKGSVYFLANREVAALFCAEHTQLLSDLKCALASDEIFFATIYVRWARQNGTEICLTPPSEFIQGLHYIRKRNPKQRPLLQRLFFPVDLRVLDEGAVRDATKSPALFARKCCPYISNQIEKIWQT